ncbi:hypothetical protein C8Q80DRAFT_1276262 [Daedaleopsis nitida]|nr:hypothetical protein C8Q80DRAFT_1276262 [Daedaleopsis nitida]
MAITTGMARLRTEIGGARGAIWANTMPKKVAKHLPDVDATTRAELFESITDVLAFPYDDPTRQGFIAGIRPAPSPLCPGFRDLAAC